MKISQKAKENHNELLPNHESKLKETDPEFIEIYDNFAFDEVLEHSTLPKRSRMLVTLATLITNQSINEYKIMIKGAMNLGLTPIEIKETLYQSFPYVGLAKAFDFLNATNEVFTKEGITLPLKGQSTTNRKNRKAKGKEKQAQYFGEEVVKAMAENAIPGQEHFNEFLEGYCFGDFYTRTGLNDADRELITFSIIASLGGCENQLRGHTAGNLSVGNDKETLVSAVTILMPYIGFPRTLNALAIINEICE